MPFLHQFCSKGCLTNDKFKLKKILLKNSTLMFTFCASVKYKTWGKKPENADLKYILTCSLAFLLVSRKILLKKYFKQYFDLHIF